MCLESKIDPKCDESDASVVADNDIPESNDAKMGENCIRDDGCGSADGKSDGSFNGIFSLF